MTRNFEILDKVKIQVVATILHIFKQKPLNPISMIEKWQALPGTQVIESGKVVV